MKITMKCFSKIIADENYDELEKIKKFIGSLTCQQC